MATRRCGFVRNDNLCERSKKMRWAKASSASAGVLWSDFKPGYFPTQELILSNLCRWWLYRAMPGRSTIKWFRSQSHCRNILFQTRIDLAANQTANWVQKSWISLPDIQVDRSSLSSITRKVMSCLCTDWITSLAWRFAQFIIKEIQKNFFDSIYAGINKKSRVLASFNFWGS